MGTNYYIHTKNKDFARRYFDGEYELTDEPDFAYEVHIGKKSCGWKPIFATHKSAYRSVKGMYQFLESNYGLYEIRDEYGREIPLGELKETLALPITEEGIRYRIENRGRLVEDENGPITKPIDHLEYAKADPDPFNSPDLYWKDEEGNNFMKGEFS